MNFNWNIETYILVTGIVMSTIGSIFILKKNWKQYGLLYIMTAVTGCLLCLLFIRMGLYEFPYRLFPYLSRMPFFVIVTLFPFYVLAGVRYSPDKWAWKIPFYWVLVHIGMSGEVLAQNYTQIIKYRSFWDTWDSYTWWWLFLLVFEYVGGLIVSKEYRKPLNVELLKYGKIGWLILHFILILTIFMAGFYMGRVTLK
jgi:hypothetical protein